ncbi:MAG: alpha/beta fold hydrolase [Acidobacteriota bacterium]
MQLIRHCTAAMLAALIAVAPAAARAQTPAPQQPPQAPAPQPTQPPAQVLVGAGFTGNAEFTLFLAGVRVGTEQVRVVRNGSTWVISSTAQYGAPLNLTLNRYEVKYAADWQPLELHVEATQATAQGPRAIGLSTSFAMTTAINEIVQNGVTNSKNDQVSERTIVLPNNFYAGYEALAARLAAAQPGTELPAYIAPQAEIKIAVKGVTAEQLPSPAGPIATRRYEVAFQNPGRVLDGTVTIDARSRLVRLEIPAAGLRLIRSDLATVTTRTQPIRNPTDTDVIIPAAGFNLAGTMTVPPGTGRLRNPAIVLVAGSGAVERDEVVAGIPIFAQLAGSLAQQGFVVLRYDKRGVGQSGGRSERATLDDYADDLITAVRWLAKREDIESAHISVAGHSEGGAVAMLAAAREKKIASLVLVAAPGSSGADLVLEQQRHMLDIMKVSDEERQLKIALQKKIQAAAISDKGWEALPPDLRAQADSPWFRSLLIFDPAKVMPKIKQPILIVQGDLDRQVPAEQADTLAQLARARKKAGAVELLHLPGINHLLVPATTGEVSEYDGLVDKTVTPTVAKAIVDWLRK